MKFNKPILIMLGVLTIVTLYVQIESLYWKYYPIEPSLVYSINIDNKNNKVCKGGMLLYSVDIDKKIDAPVTVRRQLVNGYMVVFDDTEPPRKHLGRQVVKSRLKIPNNMESGKWFLRWTAEYEVGPFKRQIAVNRDSGRFNVVDCK